MPAIARTGDVGVGICCCHSDPKCIGMSGVAIGGASVTTVEGPNVVRMGDVVIGGCGHVGVMVSAAAKTSVEGQLVARLGDAFAGCFTGVIASGAAKSTAS